MTIEISGGQRKKEEFPIVSFKFKNTGSSEAVLWKFFVDVQEAELDVTPEFKLNYMVDDAGTLSVSAKNVGWGPALDFTSTIVLLTPVDGKLSDWPEIGRVDIENPIRLQDGEIVSEVAVARRDHPEIVRLWKSATSATAQSHGDTERGLPRLHVRLEWTCLDIHGKQHTSSRFAYGPRNTGLFLSERGFELKHRWWPEASMRPPDVRYCSMLDATRGQHRRDYTISRAIPPGAADHFHIMLGSKQSARYKLVLGFHIDTDQVILSPTFDLEIWHPRDFVSWDTYLDGDELRLALSNPQGDPGQTLGLTRRDLEELEAFPFRVWRGLF